MDLQTLTRVDAMQLLASKPVGRIIFVVRDRPAVRLVNFVVDDDAVVIRTGPGSKLTAAVRDTIVSFEVDEIDPAEHTGWNVTVTGRVKEVRDPAEQERLSMLLTSWAAGPKEHFLRIAPELVEGVRLSADDLLTAP
jgi:uncharacterized protein